MLSILTKKFNHRRKEKYFQNPLFAVKKKYAGIGLGMHSITNIYSILRHFNIPIKYICTQNTEWNNEAKLLFSESIFIREISIILNDPEIDGVFVCAAPEAHYTLVSILLKAGKKVFVEKPPCNSFTELNTLISINKNAICKVGLQRRYWPGNKYVLQQTKKAGSYIYQFYFGPYLQGNVFTELFIHAIDYTAFLFGDVSIISKSYQKNNQGITIQLHAQHSNGVTGMIELSTQYSWNDPIEIMNINCTDELLTIKYPVQVTGLQKPSRLLNVPLERFQQNPVVTKNYFSVSNLIMPVFESNTLVLQGFYAELEDFILLVETGRSSYGNNDLAGLLPVYKVLDELNELVYPTASL